ncbi:hypothetical protein PoB_007178300 [Plakobranchus ocellatus]|uniref:Uncharacterized protein n=1 Tax=Plakobranchus ocellatus TaxID=259542 RepID=A0AAV4DMH3_9GAST|nr:hypothetical protein PoB_007178300 [Plakobranchus ocellatus]
MTSTLSEEKSQRLIAFLQSLVKKLEIEVLPICRDTYIYVNRLDATALDNFYQMVCILRKLEDLIRRLISTVTRKPISCYDWDNLLTVLQQLAATIRLFKLPSISLRLPLQEFPRSYFFKTRHYVRQSFCTRKTSRYSQICLYRLKQTLELAKNCEKPDGTLGNFFYLENWPKTQIQEA